MFLSKQGKLQYILDELDEIPANQKNETGEIVGSMLDVDQW